MNFAVAEIHAFCEKLGASLNALGTVKLALHDESRLDALNDTVQLAALSLGYLYSAAQQIEVMHEEIERLKAERGGSQ